MSLPVNTGSATAQARAYPKRLSLLVDHSEDAINDGTVHFQLLRQLCSRTALTRRSSVSTARTVTQTMP